MIAKNSNWNNIPRIILSFSSITVYVSGPSRTIQTKTFLSNLALQRLLRCKSDFDQPTLSPFSNLSLYILVVVCWIESTENFNSRHFLVSYLFSSSSTSSGLWGFEQFFECTCVFSFPANGKNSSEIVLYVRQMQPSPYSVKNKIVFFQLCNVLKLSNKLCNVHGVNFSIRIFIFFLVKKNRKVFLEPFVFILFASTILPNKFWQMVKVLYP